METSMETTETNIESPNFQTVWAALQEVAALQKETSAMQKETDRIVKETAEQQKERQKETDRIVKETSALQKETAESQKESSARQKETDRQMKETDRQIKDFNKRFGDFTNRFGEVVEYMIAPNLREKFREMDLTFLHSYSNSVIADPDNDIFLETDVKLENGDKVMLVEIKTKLTTEDVKDHVKRMEKMRVYADLHGDKRVFLGAVAGVVITPNVKDYALVQGFFVIEPSGETFNITRPNGKPKEW
jgi:hypothetical protein